MPLNVPEKILKKIATLDSIETMKEILNSDYALNEEDFVIGKEIVCYNKMDKGQYKFTLEANYGDLDDDDYFTPEFTPKEMLEYGIFEGKYLNDCLLEFPKQWFLKAIEDGKISPEGADISCNYFNIKSRQSLQIWEEKEWLYGDDNRGWFQWYCRYYCGRRDPEIDTIQKKRWKAFKRHYGAVEKNCEGDLSCRPKQRQALLQWSYDCFV
jgi:hypothetical protein